MVHLFLSLLSFRFHSGYPLAVSVLRDRASVSLEDEDNLAVIENASLFTSRVVFGMPNVVSLFIRTAMEGALYGDKIMN